MKSFEEVFKVGKDENLKEFVTLPIDVEDTDYPPILQEHGREIIRLLVKEPDPMKATKSFVP
jgi:hypothetical protein